MNLDFGVVWARWPELLWGLGGTLFLAISGMILALIIGILGVAIAIGFTVLALAFAVGHVSGGHFNPAVTLGLIAGGRVAAGAAVGYIAAQCLGAVAACAAIASGDWPRFAAPPDMGTPWRRSRLKAIVLLPRRISDKASKD